MLWAYTSLSPTRLCLFGAQPPTQMSTPPSFYTPVYSAFLATFPDVSLLWVGSQGSPPAMTSSFPTHPKAHSQQPIPLLCNFVPSVFFPQPRVSSFNRKTAGRGGKAFLSAGMRGKLCLPGACMAHGMGLPPTSCLGWAPGSIPDESRQFLCPLGTVAACCSQRMKTY